MTDVLDMYSVAALQRRLERSLELVASESAKVSEAHVSGEATARSTPRDCVRQLAVVGDDSIQLVGYDYQGRARIKLDLPADEDPATWEPWIMRWLHKKYGRISLVR